MIVNTIADLVALTLVPSDNHVHVLGYNTPADGGGGDFYWDATSHESQNYGTVFEGATSTVVSGVLTGRWLRYYSESINVKWFGATGDGTTNDSPAFQKMIDYCEPAGVKDVVIPFGDFYLEESVYIPTGSIKFIGQGSLMRENIDGQSYVNGDLYNGSNLIVKSNISAIVYDTTVTGCVYWRGISFKKETGRSEGGTTYAIDFRSTYSGPTWPFNVHECFFGGFNRVFSFDSGGTTQNINFMNITNCAFVDNDEVIYQGFYTHSVSGSNNTSVEVHERYNCWGLNFDNNKCHWNSRVIYGCFGKDLVTISNNNFEGNTNYGGVVISGTPPPYCVELETFNCAVNFHGNHFEAMVSDCVYISSLAKNPDGSYKSIVVGAAPYVDIYGNNVDGVYPQFKAYTLEGCIVRINESRDGAMSAVFVHQCEILENSRALIYLTDYAKENGTIIKFTTPEELSPAFINGVNSYGTGLVNNSKGFLENGKQWVRTARSGFAIGNGHAFKGDVKYCIATFKMRNNNSDGFASSAYCKFTQNGTTNPDYYVYGTKFPPVGDSIFVCIFPSDGVFTSSSDNVFSVGIGSGYYSADITDLEVCSSVFMYTTMEENPLIIPVFEPTNIVDENNGTFIEGQTFFNGTDLKMVTGSGTISTPGVSNVYYVTDILDNKIQLNSTYDSFTQGQYIDVTDMSTSVVSTYRIIELNGLWATLDNAPTFTTGSNVDFHTPTFSNLITDDNIGDYAILNQNASAQTANGWIDGDFTANGRISAGSNGVFSEGDVIIKSSGLQLKRDLMDQSDRRNWGMSTENNIVGDWNLTVSTTNNGATTDTVISALGSGSGKGNVGIGVTNPAQKLDVDGTIRQSNVTSAMLKANSSGDIVAAIANTDYMAPISLTSGTYTPTIAAISGLNDTYTIETFTYTRIGNVVHVAGTVKIGPDTYGNPLRKMYISLPIASTVGEYEVTGVGNGNDSNQVIRAATICGDAVNNTNTAEVTYDAVAFQDVKSYLQFDYTVQ